MPSLRSILFLLFFILLPLTSQAQSVLVMGANDPNWNAEVQAKIAATGLFDTVDIFDLTTGTPSLDELQNYCGVLAYTDSGSDDPDLLGDNLADYIDGGGGVVAAVFATASEPWGGRFETEDYWAIEPTSQQQDSQETIGTIFVPNHPILKGVTSFDGGTSLHRPSMDSLHPEATRIADWTGGDNIPLIATRVINGVRRADLGFYPPSTDSRDDFWVASTDGDLIMANSLLWVCAGTVDLSLTKTATPSPATVGENLTYTLTVQNLGPGDATNLSLMDELPGGVTFVSASPAGNCSESGGVVLCDLGTLAATDSTAVTLVVTPQNEGLISNTATVMSDETDSNPDNNSASAETLVQAAVVPPVIIPDFSGGACILGKGSLNSGKLRYGMVWALPLFGLWLSLRSRKA